MVRWLSFLTTEYTEYAESGSFIFLKAKEFQIIKSLIQISVFSVHSVVEKFLVAALPLQVFRG